MLLSHKKEKNKNLPNIPLRNNLKSYPSSNKNINNETTNQQILPNNIKPNISPTITIMDNINKNSSRMKYHLNPIRSNSMIKLGNKNRFRDFEKIKIYKGKAIEVIDNKELNKTNKNELKLSKEFNKRNIYLYKKNFNYSCNVDKSNTFSLRLNKKPKENFKEQIIDLINSQINVENNEFKYPRMVNIIKRNNFIYDEVAYQPWKYPDIFAK